MIVLKNLTKIYELNKNNKTVAIKNINLQINEGELIVLKGASGSGKSTILSLLAGLSKPSSGEVIINNRQISKLPDNFASDFRQKYIGFIFQKYNLIPNLSVQDNILLPLVPKNLDSIYAKELLEKVMYDFKIEPVAIARSQINNPKIVIADEPTANLDKELSKHFISILKELKNKGKTIIVASHDPLFFDLDFATKVIEISNGEIVL